MGCDIHSHIEVKIDGIWRHWHNPCITRDYKLFGRLAGVRCSDEPHPPIRGLPDDVTFETRFDFDNTFGHTASWITHEELWEIHKWMETREPWRTSGHGWHVVVGYFLGNTYTVYKDSSDLHTDARMVFWFDN